MFKKIDELVEENAKLKEALARVEAERDWWKEQRDILADYCRRADERARTAQAQLAEAVGLLNKIAEWPNGGNQYGQEKIKCVAQDFLARHAQAEQQEAQGSQAGMELVGYANFDQLDNMLDERTATLHPKKTGFAGTPVYRALATQPAAGEPIAYVSAATIAKLKLGKSAPATLFAPPIPEEHHGVALYTAPPAAAHGDEIESLAVNRYRPTPDGLLHYKVVAGDGRRSLFTGTKAQCYLVAAKLTEAFLDGAYVQNSAAHEAVPMKMIGESHEEQGVVWTGPNPHAWPTGTKFYAMRAQAGEGEDHA